MGGMSFYEKMLDNLTVSREYLMPFTETRGFEEIANFLKGRFQRAEDMQRLKAIEFTVEHLVKIQMMFNTMGSFSAEAVFPKIEAFDESGWFESELEDGKERGTGLSVHFIFDKRETVLTLDNLDDLIRGAIFTITGVLRFYKYLLPFSLYNLR